ncbi:MAG: hypothetical protein CMK23_09675 [Porticoccaceae bacterium]|nr:hypothetical protein [Porticoccaceae bacterium]
MADPLLNQREENRTPTTSPIEDTGAASLSRMPGDYLVDKLVIKSPNIDSPIDLTPVYDTISIYEDLSSSYLLCDISIIESFGLRELIPIIGEEFIEIIASTRGVTAGEGSDTGNLLDGIISKVFRVTSISPMVSTNDRVKNYVLHCTSVEAIINEKTRISRGYPNFSYDQIIEDIYDKDIMEPLRTDYAAFVPETQYKKIIIEPTEGIHNLGLPFKKPFQHIDDLAEKALSLNEPEADQVPAGQVVPPAEQAGGALYMFYETLSFFRFESLETIFKREPKRHIFATPGPALDAEDNEAGFNSVLDFEVDGLFDIVDNLREGMYASKLITHDMTRMRYTITGYSYVKRKDIVAQEDPATGATVEVDGVPSEPESSVQKLEDLTLSLSESGTAGKLVTDKNDLLNDKDNGERSKIKFMSTKFNHSYFFNANRKAAGGGAEPNIKESQLERRTQIRDSQLQQLNNIKITLKMYGDSSLRVGEVINFYVPSQSIQEGQENVPDVFLSGKYLITKIKHEFTAEKYLMHVQIRKDSYSSDLPAFDQALNQNRQLRQTSKQEILEQQLGAKKAEPVTTPPGAANDIYLNPGSGVQ